MTRPWLLLALVLVLAACSGNTGSEGGAESEPPSIVWTQHALPADFQVHALAVVGDRIVGLADDEIESPTPRTRLWFSDDGASWKAVDVDTSRFGGRAGYFQQIAQVGARYVGIVKVQPIDGDPVDIRLVVSDDVLTWNRVDIGDAYPIGLTGGDAGGIALIRFDDSDAGHPYDVLYSVDGTAWVSGGSSLFEQLEPRYQALAVGDTFYLLGHLVGRVDSRTPALLSSSTGSGWEPVDLPDDAAQWSWMWAAGVNGDLVFFVGTESGSELWLRSPDGTWAEVTPDGFDAVGLPGFSVLAVSATGTGPALVLDIGGPGLSARGEDPSVPRQGALWWSLDGGSWTQIAGAEFTPDGYIELAAALNGTIVVVHRTYAGRSGTVWTGRVGA